MGGKWVNFGCNLTNLYNRVVLLPELHADRYLIRASEARISGLEIALSANDGPLAWNVSYSYSVERVSGVWHKRSWDQPHVLKGGLSWNGAQWRIGTSFVYRDGWPVTGLITRPEQPPSELNRERLDDYFSLDIHVGRIFESELGQLEVYLDVTNLTDNDNVGGSLYQADFSVDESDLLPVIPSLGVRWTWP